MTLAMSNAHVLSAPGEQFYAVGAMGFIALLVFGWVVLFLAALISILGSQHTGGMKLVWLVLAFMAPILGSLLWFVVGRGDARRRRTTW